MSSLILVKATTGTSYTLYRWDGSSWGSSALDASIDHQRPRPYAITDSKYFVVDVGGFANPRTKSAGSQAVSPAQKTLDSGSTWTSAALGDETSSGGDEFTGFAHIVVAVDGRIWGVRQKGTTTAHPVRSEIYYSDDDGVTWTLSSTLSVSSSARFPIRLLVHPTDANTIAIISAANYDLDDRCITYITTNRGSSWSTNGATVASGNNFVVDSKNSFIGTKHWVMLSTGRIVAIHGTIGGDSKIYTSDDSGTTWTLRLDASLANTYMILAGGTTSKLVTFRARNSVGTTHDDYAFVSTDAGVTWTQTGAVHPRTDVAGNNWSAKYDPVSDTLYVYQGDVTGANAHRVESFTPVTAGGTWTDVSSGLASGTGNWDSIDIFPSVIPLPATYRGNVTWI